MPLSRRFVGAGLCVFALPFAWAVGATFGEAYRCPRGEECVASVGAFVTAGMGSLNIAVALVAAAIAINVSRSERRRVALAGLALAVVISAVLFSFVWFTPHPCGVTSPFCGRNR